jgi:non-ribosomal peptide synthetase component E (peptide arylation enzyme)
VAMLTGAHLVLMRRWSADKCLALIEEHRISYALLMPTYPLL